MKLPLLSQYDPRWADITMGKSGVSLKKAGCLTTTLSIASAYFEYYIPDTYHDPAWMAKHLPYTRGGLLIWDRWPQDIIFELEARLTYIDNSIFDATLRSKEKCLILEINHGAHFVFALAHIIGYRVIDPWGGKIKWYKDQITGGRILRLRSYGNRN